MNARTSRLLRRQSVLLHGPKRAKRLKKHWNKLTSHQRRAARIEMALWQGQREYERAT